MAEPKNDVSGSGFAEVLVRSDNERAVLALREFAATALKLAGVTVKIEESALYASQVCRLAESLVKGVKDGCANKFGLPCQALRTGVLRRTSSPALACEILCCDGEQLQEGSGRQDSL